MICKIVILLEFTFELCIYLSITLVRQINPIKNNIYEFQSGFLKTEPETMAFTGSAFAKPSQASQEGDGEEAAAK